MSNGFAAAGFAEGFNQALRVGAARSEARTERMRLRSQRELAVIRLQLEERLTKVEDTRWKRTHFEGMEEKTAGLVKNAQADLDRTAQEEGVEAAVERRNSLATMAAQEDQERLALAKDLGVSTTPVFDQIMLLRVGDPDKAARLEAKREVSSKVAGAEAIAEQTGQTREEAETLQGLRAAPEAFQSGNVMNFELRDDAGNVVNTVTLDLNDKADRQLLPALLDQGFTRTSAGGVTVITGGEKPTKEEEARSTFDIQKAADTAHSELRDMTQFVQIFRKAREEDAYDPVGGVELSFLGQSFGVSADALREFNTAMSRIVGMTDATEKKVAYRAAMDALTKKAAAASRVPGTGVWTDFDQRNAEAATLNTRDTAYGIEIKFVVLEERARRAIDMARLADEHVDAYGSLGAKDAEGRSWRQIQAGYLDEAEQRFGDALDAKVAEILAAEAADERAGLTTPSRAAAGSPGVRARGRGRQ